MVNLKPNGAQKKKTSEFNQSQRNEINTSKATSYKSFKESHYQTANDYSESK